MCYLFGLTKCLTILTLFSFLPWIRWVAYVVGLLSSGLNSKAHKSPIHMRLMGRGGLRLLPMPFLGATIYLLRKVMCTSQLHAVFFPIRANGICFKLEKEHEGRLKHGIPSAVLVRLSRTQGGHGGGGEEDIMYLLTSFNCWL